MVQRMFGIVNRTHIPRGDFILCYTSLFGGDVHSCFPCVYLWKSLWSGLVEELGSLRILLASWIKSANTQKGGNTTSCCFLYRTACVVHFSCRPWGSLLMIGMMPAEKSKCARSVLYFSFCFVEAISIKRSESSYNFLLSLFVIFGKFASVDLKAASTISGRPKRSSSLSQIHVSALSGLFTWAALRLDAFLADSGPSHLIRKSISSNADTWRSYMTCLKLDFQTA